MHAFIPEEKVLKIGQLLNKTGNLFVQFNCEKYGTFLSLNIFLQ